MCARVFACVHKGESSRQNTHSVAPWGQLDSGGLSGSKASFSSHYSTTCRKKRKLLQDSHTHTHTRSVSMGPHSLSTHTCCDLLQAPFFRLSLFRPPFPASLPPSARWPVQKFYLARGTQRDHAHSSKYEESKFPITNSLWLIFEDTFEYSSQTQACFAKLSTE